MAQISFGAILAFYASAIVLAGDAMFPECRSLEQILLARCLGYLLMEFDQTFTSINVQNISLYTC